MRGCGLPQDAHEVRIPRRGLAESVLHTIPASNVTGAHLVWRTAPYLPEIEHAPHLEPTKLGIFLRANSSGMDAVHTLVREPCDVLAWSSRARSSLAALPGGVQPSDRVRLRLTSLCVLHFCL